MNHFLSIDYLIINNRSIQEHRQNLLFGIDLHLLTLLLQRILLYLVCFDAKYLYQ